MEFYNTFIKLCNLAGKSPSRVALEIGTSKPAVTRWKGGSMPSDATLQKVADYFNVSVEYLKGESIQKETPAADSDETLMFALYGCDNNDITPAMLDKVREFARFVREEERRKKNDTN